MWFRLDGMIRHLLLDEFQDTSPVQWRILNNLAEQMLSEADGERSVFVVGDVKQSIYSWREAEPRLLLNLEARFRELGGGPDSDEYCIKSMKDSYRSSRVVLEAVNKVFDGIGERAAFGDGPRATGARAWAESYEPHAAAIERPGCAYLLQVPKGDTGVALLEIAMKRVAAISEEAPHCTIGILLRRNKYISTCINLLRRMNIRASGEGGNKLTDSAAVQQALSALHFADHPDDTLAAFHVASSPFGAALGLVDGGNDEARIARSRDLREALAKRGYGQFLSDVIARIDRASFSEWDHRRLTQLVDLAFGYDADASLRPGEFVKHVRETSVEDPSSARVKVMTVHASKGLEFDVVVLPELNDPAIRRSSLVSSRPPECLTDPLLGVSATSNELVMQSNEKLDALWRASEERDTREFLSLLYVAMTRAVHRLEMIVQHPPKDGSSLTAAALLLETLGGQEPDENYVVWQHPESQSPWFAAPKKAEKQEAVGSSKPLKLSGGSRALARKSPSSSSHSTTRYGARLLQTQSQSAATRGVLFHRWFEEIEWLEGFKSTDEQLAKLGERIECDETVVRECLAEFRSALASPEIAELLTRGELGAHEVWRERSFSLILPDEAGVDELWNGSFDRVVIRGDSAEIIDFKTDNITGDEAEAHAQQHAHQLAAYARVLEAMLAPRKLEIERKIAFIAPGVIVPLND